ncbi:MAG: TIGR04002 family protein [Cellulosilyticaceae bacterium]
MKQSEKTRLIVMTAMFAALVFVVTRMSIPLGINNRIIHVGDAVIYLAACILPMPYAMLSGAIGAGLADFMTPGCMIWVIPTMIIKPLLVLCFTAKTPRFVVGRNVCGVFIATGVGLLGYAIAEGILFGNFIAPIMGLPMGALQPIGSGIVFVAVGYAFDQISLKTKIYKREG